jgi:PKD repeat protein
MNLTNLCQVANITDTNITLTNFTNTPLLCITGTKFQNETGQGLSGWNITVSNESGQVAVIQTNATGVYQLCNLMPGNYTVCEEMKPGWTNVTPACVDVVLDCTNATVDFENDPPAETYCVEGFKRDICTDEGLSGWNITVRNEAALEVGNATTNATGYYQICNLSPGNYTVCEELEEGWVNVTDLCHDIEITDSNFTQVNFFNTRLLCISGNKTQSGTGQGLPGWNITVSPESGQVVVVQTNATGVYQVCNLEPGNYTVCEEVKEGWVNVSPACVDVVLNCENQTVDFENDPLVETYCIEGYKIDNCTGMGLPGWTIVVNEDGSPVGNAVTNSSGYYSVCNLTPGIYEVCEQVQSDWVNVSPRCQYVTITEANRTNINFTNTRLLCIEGYKINGQTMAGLPGWQINLTNSTGLVGSITTDANGRYRFCGLQPGSYTVCETLQTGWLNLTPVCREVTLTCSNATNMNFTNNQTSPFCCSCTPVARFTSSLISGRNYQFTDTSSSTVDPSSGPQIVQWYWDFGDNTNSTLQNPTHQYSRAGRFRVTLNIRWRTCSGEPSSFWKSYSQTLTVR